MFRRLSIFFIAIILQAQTGGEPPKTCDATDWKARAENLEEQVTLLNKQMAAMGEFFTLKDQVAAKKAQEPPKPKIDK